MLFRSLTSGPAGAPLPTGIAHNSSKILDTGSYFFSESGPQGYALVSASGACQVVDGKLKLNVTRHDAVCTVVNEQTVIRVNESFATTAVTEGGAQDCVWLTLNHKPSGPVTVSVTPRSGEITVNKTSVTLDGNNWNLLDPNQQSNAFCVSAVDDSLDDGGDTLCKNGLAALFGGSLVTDQACGDGLTFVDLALSNSGDARYGAFTPFVSNTLEELDANPASVDVLVQDNDTAGVTLTPAYGVAALDEDGTPVGEACYWVTLDSQPTASVTISAVADAQVAISPASVTLDATNWNLLDGTQPVNRICVTPVNDAVKDDTGSYCADQVADLFGGPVTGQTCGDHLGFVSHAATSADPLYNAISTFRSIGPDFDSNPATLDVLIRNEDVAKVKISPTHLSVVEGGGTEYHVVLTSQPTGPVTVSNGETTLVFDPTNWNVPQTVPVSTLDNDLVDGPREQLFSHTVTSADANYNGLVPSVVSLVIADNDQASLQIGLISPVSGQLVVSEDGQTASYTVQLTAQPTADINVSITVDGQITVGSTSLVFTAANWNVAQTVIVSAVDDDIVEAPTVSLIQHTVSSGDPLYNGQVAPVVETLVLDNDGAGVVITAPDPFQLQEGAVTAAAASGSNSATYTIHLASQPLADVTVFVGYGDRLSAQPASLLFTAANWNVPQAVTLTVKDDDIYQGTQVMLVIHTIISNDSVYHGLPVAPLVVTLLDDESNGGNGPIDGDSDGDGIPDSVECPAQPCRDSDGDGIPDYLDPDDDNDGVPTEVECPGGSNCPDSDDDGTPDYLDPNVPGNHGNNNGGNNGNNGGNNGNNGGNNGNNGNNNGGNGLGAGQTLFLPLVGK